VTLADLADALGVAVPAVREGLLALSDRLASVGFRAWEDGAVVRVEPLPPVAAAVGKVTSLDLVGRPSPEQLAVLMVIAYLGTATRRDVERWRGEDSESLIDRLVAKGFLEKARDTAPRSQRLPAHHRRACLLRLPDAGGPPGPPREHAQRPGRRTDHRVGERSVHPARVSVGLRR
jgi:hypothetical protein